MKVLVCGSRAWGDVRAVFLRLQQLPASTVVIVGYDPEKRRPRGADEYAYVLARALGLETKPFPAEWEKFGKRAGLIRNVQMVDEKPGLVIAFWDGHSDGTRHTLNLAADRGIPVEVIAP